MDDLQWRAAQAEWEDEANWHLFGTCYHAPRDPRVWVRKPQPQFGWTINFARGAAWVWLSVLVAGVPASFFILHALRVH